MRGQDRSGVRETWIEDQEWDTVFCAYKLCRVEFPFWGFQTRVERYAHDYGIRKLLVKAHRQAWVWQDSYHGLTIEDIRELELETQRMLQELYAQVRETRDAHKWYYVCHVMPMYGV
eukprot:sb/3476566/